MGRSGRALLVTLLITTVVAGVVSNILRNNVSGFSFSLKLNTEKKKNKSLFTFIHSPNNQSEVLRVFVCTTMIHIRLTKMKFELFTTPFLNQFDEAIKSREYLQQEVKRMTDFIHPAIEVMENPDPKFVPDNTTKQTEPKDPANVTGPDYALAYRKKLSEQCHYQILETQSVCRQNYSHLYTDCVDAVILINSYCDPFKVENYCNISKVNMKYYFRKLIRSS